MYMAYIHILTIMHVPVYAYTVYIPCSFMTFAFLFIEEMMTKDMNPQKRYTLGDMLGQG